MSRTWWNSAKTTQGHGIFSQYKPDHLKEWVAKEHRKQARATSPEKSFYEKDSFLRSSLHHPTEGEPIEHRHHAATKTLEELKYIQAGAPTSTSHCAKLETNPSIVVRQPLKSDYLPHLAHHYHFGWNPPTPQAQVALVDSHKNHYKYGDAQGYNHSVFVKASLITTRKP